jgi:ketosteroid isomerase-like protein
VFAENVERLQAMYDAFNLDKDFDLEFLTPDVEFRQPDEIGGGDGVYHGREGVARGLKSLVEIFGDVRAEPEEFFDAGTSIVVFVSLSGQVRGSSARVEAPFAHIWRFRGEQVDQWHVYPDRQQALQAVGLAQ